MLGKDLTTRVDGRPDVMPKVAAPATAEHELQAGFAKESYSGKARSLEGRLMHQLTVAGVLKGAAVGAASDVPFEGLMASQAYRRKEITASQYVAKIATSAVGFGVWTGVAGALGLALAPLGLPAFAGAVLAMGAGMIGQNVFDRVIGKDLEKRLGQSLDEKKLKPMADSFTKYIANPLNDYFWAPTTKFLKGHKLLSAGAGLALALKFPGAAKFVGREGAVLAGGTLLGMAADKAVLNPLMGKPAEQIGPTKSEDGKPSEAAANDPMAAFVDGYRTELAHLREQGLSEGEARRQLRLTMQKLLVKEGYPAGEVARMLNEVEAASTEAPTS